MTPFQEFEWLILGSGFIGTSLHNQLLSSGKRSLLVGRPHLDLTQDGAIGKLRVLLENAESLIVTSGISRVRSNNEESGHLNVGIAESIAHALHPGLERVFFLSSIDVYGTHPILPITEKTQCAPSDAYSRSKLISESIIGSSATQRGIPFTALRLPGVYGVGDHFRSLIGSMVLSALSARTVEVVVRPAIQRDLFWSGDLADVIDSITRHDDMDVVNVVTGQSNDLLEVAKAVRSALPGTEIVEVTDSFFDRAPLLVFDNSRLGSVLDPQRLTPIQSGISSYVRAIWNRAIAGHRNAS